MRACAEFLDDARFITFARLREPRENAFALTYRAAFAARQHDNLWRRFVMLPTLRSREQFAVGVLPGNFEHEHIGQHACFVVAAFWSALDCAFLFEFFEDAFQRDALIAFDMQRARDIAFRAGGIARER